MNKVLSKAPSVLHAASQILRSQIVHDVSALWAVATFILAVIYFSEIAAAMIIIARNV